MLRNVLAHLRAQWMGALALVVVITGGTAYAADTIFSSDIVDGEVKTADLGQSAVRSSKIATGQVQTVDLGDGAVTEAKLSPAAQLIVPDLLACTSPSGLGNWTSDDVGYLRDRDGIVHLQGSVACIRNGTPRPMDSKSPIFKLPPGYRGAATGLNAFVARSDTLATPRFVNTIAVTNLGFVAADTAAHRVYLDGISFRCRPSGSDGCP